MSYSKQTWLDNDESTPINAARISHMEDGIWGGHYKPSVKAWHTVDQALVSAQWTTLAFNSTLDAPVAGTAATPMHDGSVNNSRLYAPENGRYLVSATAEWAAAAGNRGLRIGINGATNIYALDYRPGAGTVDNTVLSLASVLTMQAGDYVIVQAVQNSGSGVNVLSRSPYSPIFGLTLLHST